MCTALVCGAQCSMPARLGHWQSRTSSICSEMTGQWSDRSAMSGCKTLSPPGPMSYLCGLALRIWTSFWRREDFDGMDMLNAPVVQSRQPLTYRLMESMGLGGPKWHGSSWQRGIAESGSSRLSTLMIDVPGDLVWDLPCVQQAIYLEGGPLMWMLPLYLHINQNSDYDDIWYSDMSNKQCLEPKAQWCYGKCCPWMFCPLPSPPSPPPSGPSLDGLFICLSVQIHTPPTYLKSWKIFKWIFV